MVRKKFLRSKWRAHSKLGKGRKKKQKWRRPRGRDTKMRLQKKGNPRIVKVGYKKQKKKERETEIVKNINELLKAGKKKVILAKVGNKKKIEIIKKAEEKNIEIININIKKFLEKVEKQKKMKEEKKEEKKSKAEKKKGKKEAKREEKKKETLEDKTEKGAEKEEETKKSDKVGEK